MAGNRLEITAAPHTRSMSALPVLWDDTAPWQPNWSVHPIRRTCILSPKHAKKLSAGSHQLVNLLETRELTNAKVSVESSESSDSTSEPQLDDESSEDYSRMSSRKKVIFVTKTGEGESSLIFRERTKRTETGEYRLVLGGLPIPSLDFANIGTAEKPHSTPKKSFVTREEKASFLRSEARQAKNKARLGV